MKLISVVLATLVIVALTSPALAEFPTTVPDWWDPGESLFGAAIYKFDSAPADSPCWVLPDQWIPDPPPEWMTDDSENNFCCYYHDFAWMEDGNYGGRSGGFIGIDEGAEGNRADLDIGLDNVLVPAWHKRLFVALDVWTQLENWENLVEQVSVTASYGGPGPITWGWEDPQAGGWRQLTIECELYPQPGCEWVHIDFNVPVGNSLVLDNACIASLCVTEQGIDCPPLEEPPRHCPPAEPECSEVDWPDTTATSNVESYSCAPILTETGPEDVYKVILETERLLTVQVFPEDCDLDIFLLGSCDEGDCIAYSASPGPSVETITECLSPGTYYIVVDGTTAEGCPYTICMMCDCCLPSKTESGTWGTIKSMYK